MKKTDLGTSRHRRIPHNFGGVFDSVVDDVAQMLVASTPIRGLTFCGGD